MIVNKIDNPGMSNEFRRMKQEAIEISICWYFRETRKQI